MITFQPEVKPIVDNLALKYNLTSKMIQQMISSYYKIITSSMENILDPQEELPHIHAKGLGKFIVKQRK